MAKRKIQDAIVDALGSPMPNGRVARVAGKHAARLRPVASPVTITRPAVYGWRCDACEQGGSGWLTMSEHARETNHRQYTPLGRQRVSA